MNFTSEAQFEQKNMNTVKAFGVGPLIKLIQLATHSVVLSGKCFLFEVDLEKEVFKTIN